MAIESILGFCSLVCVAPLVRVALLNYDTRCGGDTRSRWITVDLRFRVIAVLLGPNVLVDTRSNVFEQIFALLFG